MIFQCDPGANYLALKEEIDTAVHRVLDGGWYVLGKEVAEFEREFAGWLGVRHAVGVANGTDAIELALRAMRVGEGDKVATVSHTAVATVAGIRRCGAVPRFVDIEPDRFTMAPESLARLLQKEPDIRALVVVHLYGQMADMPAIMGLAEKHGLIVIEDCAQAHGATLGGRPAGTWGEAGAFSFYPTKNLGAVGDGGAVVTNDTDTALRLRALRQYGWDDQRISRVEGVNSRLDELQAAILRVKLRHLDAMNAGRARIARRYLEGLAQVDGIQLPTVTAGGTHVWHQFVIRSKRRDELAAHLRSIGIGCAVHYPRAAHMMPAYGNPEYVSVSLAETEQCVNRILSLPMYPEITAERVESVIQAIGEWQ
ncbi:DegT/DnrJ/EryC1/StrS family aminotransferase [Alcanivorax sp.]|uniref:DegT/DnrJ/EryC1/StrS family aminotransferase n=1 Tax=Alcanivorax sp. TaxID=1872427 RepID=UPI00258940B7|nr:DegT/DnrJ/EryC1/StrS family aminotransferase [Alcanivorax sp.]